MTSSSLVSTKTSGPSLARLPTIPTTSGSPKSCCSRRRSKRRFPTTNDFSTALPTIQSLADADEQQVLTLWAGLGYYSRARNLQAAAKIVVREHGGVVPDDYETLADAARHRPVHGRRDPEHRIQQAVSHRRRKCAPRAVADLRMDGRESKAVVGSGRTARSAGGTARQSIRR